MLSNVTHKFRTPARGCPVRKTRVERAVSRRWTRTFTPRLFAFPIEAETIVAPSLPAYRAPFWLMGIARPEEDRHFSGTSGKSAFGSELPKASKT